jgi:hypothetical protein
MHKEVSKSNKTHNKSRLAMDFEQLAITGMKTSLVDLRRMKWALPFCSTTLPKLSGFWNWTNTVVVCIQNWLAHL